MNHVDTFLDFCKYQRNLSENTIRSYRFDVVQFLEWVKARNMEILAVKLSDVDAFSLYLRKEKGKSVATVNRKLMCLRSLYRFLMRSEIINKNPLEFVTAIKAERTLPKYLTLEQQEALLKAARDGNYMGLRTPWIKERNHLAILFFLDTGLRVSELCEMECNNLDLKEGTLQVMGKGKKERIVILSDRLINAIKKFLSTIAQSEVKGTVGPLLPSRGKTLAKFSEDIGVPLSQCSRVVRLRGSVIKKLDTLLDKKVRTLPVRYLFFNQHGVHLDTRHVFRLVKEIGQRAGIANLHPHTLRHTFATNLRRKRADLVLIKEALGHASVSTTQIYSHLENQDYKERMREMLN